MKRLPIAFAFLLLPLLVPAFAETMNPPAPAVSGAAGSPATPAPEDKTPNFVDPAFLQADALKKFIGDYPKSGSAGEKKDIETLLKIQASRTPEEISRAKSEADLKVEAFASVLGPWFDTKSPSLALTANLLKKATHDAKIAYNTAKDAYARPRPPLVEPKLTPCVDLPKSPAYPSGHTTLGVSWSLVLAELAPDLRKQLLARGEQIGYDREIAGVHYPTDVEAGKKLGTELARRFLVSPEFQTELAKAKAEFAQARQAGAAAPAQK